MDTFFLAAMFYAALLWFVARIAADIYQARAERAAARMEQIQSQIPVLISIDEIDGMVYGWHHQTKDFVCQGRDLNEFRSAFRTRFPNRSVAIVDGPDELTNRFKRELGTLLQNELLNRQ